MDTAKTKQTQFSRCPKCFHVIRYSKEDTSIVCPNCNVKIKLK